MHAPVEFQKSGAYEKSVIGLTSITEKVVMFFFFFFF